MLEDFHGFPIKDYIKDSQSNIFWVMIHYVMVNKEHILMVPHDQQYAAGKAISELRESKRNGTTN